MKETQVVPTMQKFISKEFQHDIIKTPFQFASKIKLKAHNEQ